MTYNIEETRRQLAKNRQQEQKQAEAEYLAKIKSQLDKNFKDKEAAEKLQKENQAKLNIIEKQSTSVINNDRGISNKNNLVDSSKNSFSHLPINNTLSEYTNELSKKKIDENHTQSTVAENTFNKNAMLPSVLANQNRFMSAPLDEWVLNSQKSIDAKKRTAPEMNYEDYKKNKKAEVRENLNSNIQEALSGEISEIMQNEELTPVEKFLQSAYVLGQASAEAGYISSRAGQGVVQWLANTEDAVRSAPAKAKAGVGSLFDTAYPALGSFSDSKQITQSVPGIQKLFTGDTKGAFNTIEIAAGNAAKDYYLSNKTASDIADTVRARMEADSSDVNKEGVIGFLGNAAEAIGYQAPTMWFSGLVGALGIGAAAGTVGNLSKPMQYIANLVTPQNVSTLISMGVPSYSAAEREALRNGYTPAQAKVAGTKAFLIEGVGELLIGDTFNVVPIMGGKFGMNFLDNINSPAARAGLKVLTNALGEGGEEIVQGVLTELSDASLYGRDVKLDSKELLYEGAVGAFVGGLFGAANIRSDYKVYKSDYNYVNDISKSADSITTAREASVFKKAVDTQVANLNNEIKNMTSANTEGETDIERFEYVRNGLENVSKAVEREQYKLIVDNNGSDQNKLSNVMFQAKINDMVKHGNKNSAVALIDSEIKANNDISNSARNAKPKIDADILKKAVDILTGRNIELYQTKKSILEGTYNVEAESAKIDTASLELNQNQQVKQEAAAEYMSPTQGMTPEQKTEYIKEISDRLKSRGINNVIVEDLPQNGFYNPADRTIHINSALDEKSVVNFVIGHELTHYGASGDASLVSDIINAVKDDAELGSMFSEENRQAVKQRYIDFLVSQGMDETRATLTVDDSYVDAELAADVVGEILDEKLLETFAKEKTSLLTRIIEGIKNLMRRLIGKGDITRAKEYGRVADIIRAAVTKYSGVDITLQNTTRNADVDTDLRHSIRYTKDNVPFVTVDTDILKDVPRSEWVKTVKDNLRDKFPDGVTVGNNQISINKQSRNELTSSKYSQHLSRNDTQIYSDKFKATNNLDEILNASRDYVNESPLHTRKDNITDFARGNVLLRVGINDYIAEVIVGITSGGNMLLYDLIGLTPTTINEKSRYNNTVQGQNTENSRKVISAKDIISNNDNNVNTNIRKNSDVDTDLRYSLSGVDKDGIEIYTTNDDTKKLSYKERMKEFLNYIEHTYIGRTAKFERNGEVFYASFDPDDSRKLTHGDNKSDKSGWKAKINTGADGNIFELVENSQYKSTSPESGKSTKAHKDVSDWHYYQKTVKIDDKLYDILINIKDKGNSEHVYSIQLNESKKTTAPYFTSSVNNSSVSKSRDTVDNSISQKNNDVNTSIRKNVMFDESSDNVNTASQALDATLEEKIKNYPYDMQTVIKEYYNSIDDGILGFIKFSRENARVDKGNYDISNVTSGFADKVKNLTGTDISDYTHSIQPSAVRHIDKRHGVNGEHDHTMANENDIARIGYVLNNYDNIELSDEQNYTYKNKDNTKASILKISKRINGTYYVIEAAPDTKAKKLQIVTAYIEKNKTALQEADAIKDSEPYVRNDLASAVFNNTISQKDINVNDSIRKNSDVDSDLRYSIGDIQNNISRDSMKINPDMTDDERYEILKDKKLKIVDLGNSLDIDSDILEQVNTASLKVARPIIKALSEQFGVFNIYENSDIELFFEFTRNSLNESTKKQQKRYDNFIKMFPVFGDIAKNAIGIETHSDRYKTDQYKDIDSIYVLVSGFRDGNDIIPVRLTVKKYTDINKVSKLYVMISLNKIEADVMTYAHTGDKTPNMSHAPPASEISISEFFKNVNPNDGDLLKYIPDNFLSEAQLNGKHIAQNREKTYIEEKLAHNEKIADPDSENIQYSLGDISKLARENEKLKSRNEWLKNQMKRTDVVRPDPADVKKISENVRSAYSSQMTTPEIGSRIAGLYSYMANGEKVTGTAPSEGAKGGKIVDYNTAYDMAFELASDIVESSLSSDDGMHREYKSLITQLRQSKIAVPVSERADLDSVNGYNEFRKNNFGNFTLSDSGIPVDSLYLELSDSYPEFFSPEITAASDQIMRISDVLKSLKPVYENKFAGVEQEASQRLAQKLMEDFYDVKQAKPTFADKQAKKRVEQGVEYEHRLEQQTKEFDEATEQQKLLFSWLNAKKIHEIRQERDEAIEQQKLLSSWLNAKKIHEIRQERDEAIEQLKEKFKSKTEKGRTEQQKRILRNQIKKQVESISKTLKSPSDTKHIPQNLRTSMAELLSIVDLKTSRMKENTAERLKSLASYLSSVAKSGDSVAVLDPDLLEYIEEAKKTQGKALADLDVYELENLNRAIKSMYSFAMNQNKLLADKQRANAEAVASEVIRQNSKKLTKAEKIAAKTESPVKIKDVTIGKLFRYDMLNSESFFQFSGDALYGVYKTLVKGQDKFAENMDYAASYLESVLKGTDTKKWYTDTVKYKTESGQNIEFTPVEIMSLYRLSLQDQAMTHIEFGGISLSNMKKLTKTVQRPEVFKLSSVDVANIVSNLSAEQKAVADSMGKFLSEDCSEWGNDVSMKLYGYKKFSVKNYFPIKTDSEYRSEELGRDTRDPTLRNSGFTKARVQRANNPIVIENIFDIFDNHVSAMAAYNAYVVPLADFSKIYNSIIDGKSVKAMLGIELGSEGIKYIKNFLTDVNGKTINHQNQPWILKNYKAASVAANLSVVAKQPTAYIRAMAEIDTKYLLGALAHKASSAEMLKRSPIAQIKEWGFSDINSGSSLRERYDPSTIKLSKNVMDKMTALAGVADKVTWARLWEAVKLEVADNNKGIDTKSDSYFEKVNDRFREVISRTQVVDTVFDSSAIMRKKDTWSKMTTMFMHEPLKQYSLIRTNVILAANGDSAAKAKAVKTIFACTLNSVVVSIISSLATMYRDDEDEKSLGVDGFIGKLWSEMKENLKGDAFGMFPYVRDVKSLIDGFSVERLDMQAIGDIVEGSQKIYKYFDDVSNGKNPSVTLNKLVADMFGAIGYVFGVPFKTIYRGVSSTVRNLFQITDSAAMEYQYTKLFYNIAADTKSDTEFSGTKKFYDILYKCIERGDYESYNLIRKDMIANGNFTAEKLQNAVNKRQRGLFDKAFESYVFGDKKVYNELQKKYSEENNKFAELSSENLKTQILERINGEIDKLYSLGGKDRQAYEKEFAKLNQMLVDSGAPKDWLLKQIVKKSDATKKKNYDRLYELYMAGNAEEYDKMYREMTQKGYTEENITYAIKERIKKAE